MNPLELFKHAHNVKQFGPGDRIFAEGTQADGMYVILGGNVDIQIHGQTVNALGPGEIFGEMALIDKALRSASAIAQSCHTRPTSCSWWTAGAGSKGLWP